MCRRPSFISEREYYGSPADNFKTYPVYHPDFEPQGYQEWLKQQKPEPLVRLEDIRTEEDWVVAGKRVFEQLDVSVTRTTDTNILAYIRDRDRLRRDQITVLKDGRIPTLRWVIEKQGEPKLSLVECFGCHAPEKSAMSDVPNPPARWLWIE